MTHYISVDNLRGIQIIAPDDIYDLARFTLRIQDAGDRLRSRGCRVKTRSNVANLAYALAGLASIPAEHVITLLEANGVPPAAMVVTPAEMRGHASEG